jgi:hypothetical protein
MDSGTLAPLFTRASFIVPAPRIDGIADLSWYFMKVRFRRQLHLDARVTADSVWTEPRWTQLLPPSNVFTLAGTTAVADVADLVLGIDGFTRKDGTAVVLEPTTVASGSRCRFSLWALVTQRVVDALGRQAQEAFVELAPLAELPAALKRTVAPVVRVVEVQAHTSTSIGTQEALFAALFPPPPQHGGDAEEATARVVRSVRRSAHEDQQSLIHRRTRRCHVGLRLRSSSSL